MKTISTILLFTALALASATPWYSNSYKARAQKAGYFDSQGYYHRATETAMSQEDFPATRTHQQATNHGLSTARTQQQSLYTCQSTSHVSGKVSTYLHVCERGGSSGKKEYCYITDGSCCKEEPEKTPVDQYELQLNGQTLKVKYYNANGGQDACFVLRDNNGSKPQNLPVCNGCMAPSCTGVVPERNRTQCVAKQDIYFIFDNTVNNHRETFCETHYGTELLLKALNPGSNTSGTRVEAVLYPKVGDRDEERVAYTLFGLGTGCREAIGEILNLVDGFYDPLEASQRSPLLKNNQVRGNFAYPATAIKTVREKIQGEITEQPELRDRQRVVVMIADAETDERNDNRKQKDRNPNTFEEAQKLRDIPNLTLIVAGNDVDYKKTPIEWTRFYHFLHNITGPDDVVMRESPKGLVEGIIERMARPEVRAICEDQKKNILDQLERSRTIGQQCDYIEKRKSEAVEENENDFRVPSSIWCPGDTSSDNPYYVGSPSYSTSVTFQRNFKDSKKSQLEQEILQAVEKVLGGRLDIK